MGVGFVLQRSLTLDIRTLNAANIYAFVPALLFIKLLKADLVLRSLGLTALFISLNTLVMLFFAVKTAKAFGMEEGASAIGLGGSFGNTGNYGLPLMQSLFGGAGVAAQSISMTVNNILCFTFGLWTVAGDGKSALSNLKRILKMPVIYAFLAVIVIRVGKLPLPAPVEKTAELLGNGLVPVALLTLGAQLAETKFRDNIKEITVGVTLKLLVAPLLMAFIVILANFAGVFGEESILPQLLILNAALPSAVNTVLLARQFDKQPEVAAGIISIGTAFSAFTIALLIRILNVCQ